MYTYTPKRHLFPLQYVDAYFLRFFNNSYVINKHQPSFNYQQKNMKEVLKEHDGKFLSLLLQQRHDSISFLVTSCSYVEGLQDPYLFIGIGTSYFLLETPQMRYSHRIDRPIFGQQAAGSWKATWRSCDQLQTTISSYQDARSNGLMSRSIFQDEAIDILFYTGCARHSRQGLLLTRFYDSYVCTWNTEESTKNVKASVMTLSRSYTL